MHKTSHLNTVVQFGRKLFLGNYLRLHYLKSHQKIKEKKRYKILSISQFMNYQALNIQLHESDYGLGPRRGMCDKYLSFMPT